MTERQARDTSQFGAPDLLTAATALLLVLVAAAAPLAAEASLASVLPQSYPVLLENMTGWAVSRSPGPRIAILGWRRPSPIRSMASGVDPDRRPYEIPDLEPLLETVDRALNTIQRRHVVARDHTRPDQARDLYALRSLFEPPHDLQVKPEKRRILFRIQGARRWRRRRPESIDAIDAVVYVVLDVVVYDRHPIVNFVQNIGLRAPRAIMSCIISSLSCLISGGQLPSFWKENRRTPLLSRRVLGLPDVWAKRIVTYEDDEHAALEDVRIKAYLTEGIRALFGNNELVPISANHEALKRLRCRLLRKLSPSKLKRYSTTMRRSLGLFERVSSRLPDDDDNGDPFQEQSHVVIDGDAAIAARNRMALPFKLLWLVRSLLRRRQRLLQRFQT